MGMFMSFMGKGPVPSTQMISFVMGTVYKQFVDRDIKNFEDFHIAILDIFATFNTALPGMHYDVPSRKAVEECFNEWKQARDPESRRKKFVQFMTEKLNLSRLDDSTMVTGLVTPPAAMAAKRAGENLPQLKLIKVIPDVIFVPTATVLALVSAKLTKRMLLGSIKS